MIKSGVRFIFTIIILVVLSARFCHLQARTDSIHCPYLINTDLNIGFADSCAVFWKQAHDATYGGFYTKVNRDGSVTGGDYMKTMLTQTRNAYAFVRAFMMTGEESFLEYARSALDFMYDHAWDSKHTGWFNEMSRQGALLRPGQGAVRNNDKWSFMQHYALLGIAAMVEATRNARDADYLSRGRRAVDTRLWDSREGYEGYYDQADLDWSNPRHKGFTPTVDAITTHALALYLIEPEEVYKTRLVQLADQIVTHMIPTLDDDGYGFTESFSSEWEPFSNSFQFTGHMLKAAWCLTRAFLIEPRQVYVDASTDILSRVHDEITTYNNMQWWELEQDITAGLMNYYITGNADFLTHADETLSFFMKYYADHEHGEVFGAVDSNGRILSDSKGNYWKAGYHSVEQAYYVYLYGNLFVHRKPVVLHYLFEPADTERTIRLSPLAIEHTQLKISRVIREGSAFEAFDPGSRTLTLSPYTGGHFEVTYTPAGRTGIASETVDSDPAFRLDPAFPNPFNACTQICFSLNHDAELNIEVYDCIGRKVAELFRGEKQSGLHYIQWDASRFSSGVYVIQIKSGTQLATQKVLLLK